MHARRLSGLDAACLAVESAAAPLHTVAVLVLDAPDEPNADPADELMHAVHALMDRNPRLRGCLAEASFGFLAPTFEDGGPPDLEQHLVRVRVPRPGGPRELGRLVDDVLSQPLPRGCPLWEMTLVEGLARGSAALVLKLHCVPLDGSTAWGIAAALADAGHASPQRTPVRSSDASRTKRAKGGGPAHSEEGLMQRVAGPARWLRATGQVFGTALSGLAGEPRPSAPRPDPPTGSRLNMPTHGGRRSAHATLRSATVDAISKVFAVSPGTVALAAIAGALRGELAAAGEIQTRPLVACVLRELPRGSSAGPARPRISLERMPSHVALPGARLRMVHREESLAPLLLPEPWPERLDDWADATAPALFSLATRIARDLDLPSRIPPFANLLVSLAADSPEQPRIGRLRIEHLHPHGPLPEGVNLHVGVQRIGGALDVGITTAGDALPDPWRFAMRLGDALRDLHDAALALDSQ